jgi:hypothetical protein
LTCKAASKLPELATLPALAAVRRNAGPVRDRADFGTLARRIPAPGGRTARAGLRELDRLVSVSERARALTDKADRRSRLPDAIETVLRVPVLTPTALALALAQKLLVAPQTATALLRDVRSAGVVREVTGRGSFRAFAI